MNKWEVDGHKQWSEKVRSHHFCPHMLDKNRNYEGIKWKKNVRLSLFKIGSIHPNGLKLMNYFRLLDPFVVSVFAQHVQTKVLTSHLFSPLFMFTSSSTSHLFTLCLHLAYWPTLKIANNLPIFVSYYVFVIVSLTWLAYFLSHGYFPYINLPGFVFIFCFSLTRGQRSNVRLYILSILAVCQPSYISIYINLDM